MSTPPGSLEGKYEVIAKIREGGMGAIYKVRHRLLNELRVIKVMRPDVAQSPEQRKRFLREAQTATRLRHPNIVAFYDFFVDEEDTAYMVMEYIEGINFRDALRACGAFPVPLAIEVLVIPLWDVARATPTKLPTHRTQPIPARINLLNMTSPAPQTGFVGRQRG